MERSIRRSELANLASSEASPEPIDRERLKTLNTFEFVETEHHDEPDDNVDADELSFRLFAPTKTEAPQVVRIRSPTPEIKEAGFLVPARKDSYYFASDKITQACKASAISFEDLQRLASIRWTGSAYPWKVLDIPASGLSRSARTRIQHAFVKTVPDEATRRRRLGKKARIKLRTKVAAAKQKAAETKVAQESKDAADREKKTRKNREKKAKKRQRDKLKVAGMNQGAAANIDSDD
ncbi:hypothetical protein AMS68_007041 [Peltaster fructicola]|uniref:Uncharacterized protein n=1 Tax=Peltaster fructicola TaxID=286661 RepID=A0A6H0Y3D6_9PEZI|nr:hypothetical protein AMS68_007041 [Peltaster fructicola]